MRLFALLPFVVAILLCAGCNPADEGDTGNQAPATNVADPKPAEVPATTKSPAEWPAWIQVYPGSDVVRSEVMETDLGEGISIEMNSAAEMDEIAQFFWEKLDATDFYMTEESITAIERFRRYHTGKTAIQVSVIKESALARILIDEVPVEETDDPLPPLLVRWQDQGKQQPGFPEDLLPMFKQTVINSSILSADGRHVILDFLTEAELTEVADHYSEFYTGRGWRKKERSQSEIAYNANFYKDGMQISLGTGEYQDGQRFVSLAYMPEIVDRSTE